MYVCKVVGKAVSTIKSEKLAGTGIVYVRPLVCKSGKTTVSDQLFAAVDPFGCAVDNMVLVTSGSNAKYVCKKSDAPVDMAVIGILDEGVEG